MSSSDPWNDARPDGQQTPGNSGEHHVDPLHPDAEPTYVAEPYPSQWTPAPATHWSGGLYTGGYPAAQQPHGYPAAQTGNAQPYGYPQQYPYPGHAPQYGYAQPYGYAPQYGYQGHYGYPPAAPAPSLGRRALIGVGSLVLAAALVLAGVAIAHSQNSGHNSAANPPAGNNGNGGAGGNGGGAGNGGTSGNGNGTGSGASAGMPVANATQQRGIVTVVSVLGYQHAESAGTGMIMTSDGEVLTNNHVINGATSVTVTVESTNKTYKADVVGTVPTHDVAVLKLHNASGLTTAKLGDAQSVKDLGVGDAVTGVGNAGGTGTLRAAAGKVTALDQSITAKDESGAGSEKLSGLIQVNAGIVSGDSGGPLYASDGDIVGIDTAASADVQRATGYAIPIDTALSWADKIESGPETSTVHIGPPPFLGVTVTPNTSGGAQIYEAIPDGPADKAGITSGSRIIAVDGTKVADSTALRPALARYQPGARLRVTWVDPGGASHTSTVTTIAGPAD